MNVTPSLVAQERDWVLERVPETTASINDLREEFSSVFGTTVDPITEPQLEAEVETVFADGPRAVNAAALIAMLRELDVEDDYPGFVVDEFLGRRLAATVAGGEPFGLLAEASFHYADIGYHPEEGGAGFDDLHAALVAGFQTRLPGWDWTEGESPFSVGDDSRG